MRGRLLAMVGGWLVVEAYLTCLKILLGYFKGDSGGERVCDACGYSPWKATVNDIAVEELIAARRRGQCGDPRNIGDIIPWD